MRERGRFLPRPLWITSAALILGIVWLTIPLVQSTIIGWRAEPRTVIPRGNLAEDERSTIELFEAARVSVVSIATTERMFNPWTRNALNVLRGTGSGFVWDLAATGQGRGDFRGDAAHVASGRPQQGAALARC